MIDLQRAAPDSDRYSATASTNCRSSRRILCVVAQWLVNIYPMYSKVVRCYPERDNPFGIGRFQMKPIRYALTAFLVAIFTITTAPSMADEAMDKAIKARKASMQLRSFYLGTLGAMAKEKIPYDAAKAGAAADSFLSVATLDGSAMWPRGSDSTAMPDKTAAKVEIWTTYPEVATKGKAMVDAATVLAAVAGNGLAELQGAIGDVGKSCGGCHKSFRIKKE